MTNVFDVVYQAICDYDRRFGVNCDPARVLLHPDAYRNILFSERYFEFCGIGQYGHEVFGRTLVQCPVLEEDQVLVVAPPSPQKMLAALLAAITFWRRIDLAPECLAVSQEDMELMSNYEQTHPHPAGRLPCARWGTNVLTDPTLPAGMFWVQIPPWARMTAVVRSAEVEWLNPMTPPTPILPLSPPQEDGLITAVRELYAEVGHTQQDREDIAACFGVPFALIGLPDLLVPYVPPSIKKPVHELFGEPGGEPATDICDEISALVDEQLGHEKSGYDHNVRQPKCACGEEWHGLAITEKMRDMRRRQVFDPDYVYAEDHSEVLCPGTPTAGTARAVVYR